MLFARKDQVHHNRAVNPGVGNLPRCHKSEQDHKHRGCDGTRIVIGHVPTRVSIFTPREFGHAQSDAVEQGRVALLDAVEEQKPQRRAPALRRVETSKRVSETQDGGILYTARKRGKGRKA
ncbi:hypothetical protein [Defluviimonas sp. SAOS-178_SWC]|uniref:hypothetical protein n=1 Tax=Defluviimonas sp. SAOS-178_SWC TaxID=3121287 RepID=UPI003221E32C